MTTVDLFTPIRLGDYTLPNRMAMAPLTRSRAGAGNVPTALMADYYTQRATAGLIITEATQVLPTGQGYPNTPGIHTAEQAAGWRTITDGVHAKGGHMFMQIWHVGRISHAMFQPGGAAPVAPSAITAKGELFTGDGMKPFSTPRALELDEIPGLVAAFADAAKRAVFDAGLDGVEVHGANGYLIDQFLRDSTNHRTDAYGGPVANRARFLLEVTEAVVKAVGPGRVGVRLSPNGVFNDIRDSDPAGTFGYAVEALNGFNLAYLHIIEGKDGTPMAPAAGATRLAGDLRRAYKGTFMLNGGFYSRAAADAALAAGDADLVSIGIPFIANPDLVERFRTGAALNTPDQTSFYGGDAKGYTDYPTLETVAA